MAQLHERRKTRGLRLRTTTPLPELTHAAPPGPLLNKQEKRFTVASLRNSRPDRIRQTRDPDPIRKKSQLCSLGHCGDRPKSTRKIHQGQTPVGRRRTR